MRAVLVSFKDQFWPVRHEPKVLSAFCALANGYINVLLSSKVVGFAED